MAWSRDWCISITMLGGCRCVRWYPSTCTKLRISGASHWLSLDHSDLNELVGLAWYGLFRHSDGWCNFGYSGVQYRLHDSLTHVANNEIVGCSWSGAASYVAGAIFDALVLGLGVFLGRLRSLMMEVIFTPWDSAAWTIAQSISLLSLVLVGGTAWCWEWITSFDSSSGSTICMGMAYQMLKTRSLITTLWQSSIAGVGC